MIMHIPLNSTQLTDAPFARTTPLPPPPVASANDNDDTNIDTNVTTPGAAPTNAATVSGPATTTAATTHSTPPTSTTITTPAPIPTRALSTAEILSHLLPFFAPVPIPVRWPDLGDDAALRNLFVCLIGDPALFVGSGVSSGGAVGNEEGGVGVGVEHAGQGGHLGLPRASSSSTSKEKGGEERGKEENEASIWATEAKEISRQREHALVAENVLMEDADVDSAMQGMEGGAGSAALAGSSSLTSLSSLSTSSSAPQIQAQAHAQQQQIQSTSTPRPILRCELRSGSDNAQTTTTPGLMCRSGSGRSMSTFSPVDWSKTKMNTSPVVKEREGGVVLSLSPHAKLILSPPGAGASASTSGSTLGASPTKAIVSTTSLLSTATATAPAPALSRSTTLSASASASTSTSTTMLPSGTATSTGTGTNTTPTQVLAVQRSYTLPPPPEGSIAELRKMSLGTAFTDKVVYAEGAFGGPGGSGSGDANVDGGGVDMVMGAEAGERMLSPESEEFFSGEESDGDGGRGGKKMRTMEGTDKAEGNVEMRTAPGASKSESNSAAKNDSNARQPGLALVGMESAISGASSLSSLTSLPSSAAISTSSSMSTSLQKGVYETESQSHSQSQAQLQSLPRSSPGSIFPSSPVVMVDLTDVKFGPPKKKKPAAPRLFLSPFKASPSKASAVASVSTLGSASTMDANAPPPRSDPTPTPPPVSPSPASGISGISTVPASASPTEMAMDFPENSQTTIEEESIAQDLIMDSGSQDVDDDIYQFSSPIRPQVSSGEKEVERKDKEKERKDKEKAKDVDDISMGVGSFSSLRRGLESQIETASSHGGMDSQIETPSTPTRMGDDGDGPETPSVSRYAGDGGWEDIVPSSCSPPTLKKDKGKGKAVDEEDTSKENVPHSDFPQHSSPLFTTPGVQPFHDEDHGEGGNRPDLESPSKPSRKSNPPSLALSITGMTSGIVRAKQELNSPINVPKPLSGGNDGLGGAEREYSYIPSVSPSPVKRVQTQSPSSSQAVKPNASANAKRRQSSGSTSHMIVDMDNLSPPPPSASYKRTSPRKQKKSLGKTSVSAKTDTVISISSGSEGEDVVEVKPQPKEKETKEKPMTQTQTATTMSQRARPKPVPISRKPTAKLDVFAKPAAEVVDLTTPVKDVPKAKAGSRVPAAARPPSPTPLASTSTSTSSKAKAKTTSGPKNMVIDDPKDLQPSQPEPEPELEPPTAPVEYDSSPLSSEGEDEPAPPGKKQPPPFDIKKYTAQLAAAADDSDDAEIITVKKKKKPILASSANGGLKRDPEEGSSMPPPGKLTRILAGKGKQSAAMTRVRKRKRSSGPSVADDGSDAEDEEDESKKPPLKRAKARNGSVASSATVERRKEREQSKPVSKVKTESVKGKEKEVSETGKRYPLRSPRKESSFGESSASVSTPKKKRTQTVVWPKVEKPNFDLFVKCDLCELWYHIGCVGMEPGDVRLRPTEIYKCPLCEVGAIKEESPVKKSGDKDEDNSDPRSRCSRGRHCLQSSIKKRKGRKSAAQLEAMNTEEAFDVEAFVGQYKKVVGGQGLTHEYLVKWLNYDYSEATWETISKMGLTDPSTLLEQFEKAAMAEGVDLQNAGDTVLLKAAAEAGWNEDRVFVKPE